MPRAARPQVHFGTLNEVPSALLLLEDSPPRPGPARLETLLPLGPILVLVPKTLVLPPPAFFPRPLPFGWILNKQGNPEKLTPSCIAVLN